MKIKKKIKKKSGSKTEILRNLEAQPKRLVSYKKKECNVKNCVFDISQPTGCQQLGILA